MYVKNAHYSAIYAERAKPKPLATLAMKHEGKGWFVQGDGWTMQPEGELTAIQARNICVTAIRALNATEARP